MFSDTDIMSCECLCYCFVWLHLQRYYPWEERLTHNVDNLIKTTAQVISCNEMSWNNLRALVSYKAVSYKEECVDI